MVRNGCLIILVAKADLGKLETKLDEVLNNETSETLFKWLRVKRK